MSPFIYIICVSLVSFMISCSTKAQEVALGFGTTAKKIPLTASSFIDLISQGVFVDKTLFINAILSNSTGALLTVVNSPKKWGKTINLDMLKTFLEIQVHPNGSRILPISSTPNYKLFTEGKYQSNGYNVKLEKPPLISNKKYQTVIDKYLGRYPVAHFSFAEDASIGKKDDIDILKEMIWNAFHEHEYLLGVYERFFLERKNLTECDTEVWGFSRFKFNEYFSRQISHEFDFLNSAGYLCQELYDHFGEKVYVLVDEYSTFFTTNISETVRLFFFTILEDNDYVEKVILTGSLPVEVTIHPLTLEFTYTPFQQFHGFTLDEMNLIYQFYQIPKEEQKNIEHWYGGYLTLENRDEIFNPWSVSNYVNSRQLKPYWMDANFRDIYLSEICKSSTYREILHHLMAGKDYDMVFESPMFNLEDLSGLNVTSDKGAALKYLFAMGFVTIKNTSLNDPQQQHIRGYRIPNYEITSYLKDHLKHNPRC